MDQENSGEVVSDDEEEEEEEENVSAAGLTATGRYANGSAGAGRLGDRETCDAPAPAPRGWGRGLMCAGEDWCCARRCLHPP